MPSTAIRHIAYNVLRREMTVTFVTGRRYVYFDVPKSVYDAFRDAPSKGAFFNHVIRDHYAYHEIRQAG